MTENKRYVAIPETVSYKDTATDEILCLKVEKEYYEVLSLLNHFHDAWFDVHEGLEQISKEYDELYEKNILLLRKNGAMEEEIECLSEENQIKLEIVDAFIRGLEDEKGIDPENKDFQCKMNFAIKILEKLKKDMLDPTEFKRLKELLE